MRSSGELGPRRVKSVKGISMVEVILVREEQGDGLRVKYSAGVHAA
jgi:hypothetical protein